MRPTSEIEMLAVLSRGTTPGGAAGHGSNGQFEMATRRGALIANERVGPPPLVISAACGWEAWRIAETVREGRDSGACVCVEGEGAGGERAAACRQAGTGSREAPGRPHVRSPRPSAREGWLGDGEGCRDAFPRQC